jgi:hypothetical protein
MFVWTVWHRLCKPVCSRSVNVACVDMLAHGAVAMKALVTSSLLFLSDNAVSHVYTSSCNAVSRFKVGDHFLIARV